MDRDPSTLTRDELEQEVLRQRKMNASLIRRVERNMDLQDDAFSLFQAATTLERKVEERTAALESAILGSVHKKGSGEFTLPGLMKIGLQQVPAKKKRFGKDPFTGEERWFPAKPASVKIKTRALKKLKDATL